MFAKNEVLRVTDKFTVVNYVRWSAEFFCWKANKLIKRFLDKDEKAEVNHVSFSYALKKKNMGKKVLALAYNSCVTGKTTILFFELKFGDGLYLFKNHFLLCQFG